MRTYTFNALPFPATNSALPEAVERSLQQLSGPLRDANNDTYKLAKPLERSRYSACPSCGIKFHLFRRKCNCVNCGQVVCTDCVENKWYLPKYGVKTVVGCCKMCDRNLQMSIKTKEALGRLPVRELRAYLQLYGLYNPSGMLEKSDLVAAVYNNSPMPQRHEETYRQSLPQPSESSFTNHAPNNQNRSNTQNQQQNRDDSDDRESNAFDGGDGSWDRMFSNIGNEMGRAFESIGQQLGSGVERGAGILDEHVSSVLDPALQPHRTQRNTRGSATTGDSSNTPNYGSQTYSSRPSNPQRQTRPRPQRSFYSEPRPVSLQNPNGPARQPPPATAAATATTQNNIPDVRSLVKDETDVSRLGIKVLKMILDKHRVDYSNIVEKNELVERVERLVRNTKLEMEREAAASEDSKEKSSGAGGGTSEDDVCKICWDASINCVFLNCGHMCTCLECGNKIVESDRRECPICRGHIAKVVHVFRV